MDLNKIIYFDSENFIEGRAIVIFNTKSCIFQLQNKNKTKIIAHMNNVISTAITISNNKSNIKEFCVIAYLSKLKQCTIGYQIPICITKILKEVFPDMLYKCYLNNPPFVFRSIYTVIRPFIDKVTRKKISIINKGKTITFDDFN